MKRKIKVVIISLIVFSSGIITFSSCEKAKEVIEDNYKIALTFHDGESISQNPMITWDIDPLPPGELKSVLRIAKVNEGETPEAALEKNGIDYPTCHKNWIQYLGNPALDTNAMYAFHVSMTSAIIKDQPQPVGDMGPIRWELTEPSNIFFHAEVVLDPVFTNGSWWHYLHLKIKTLKFPPDNIAWKLVLVEDEYTGGGGGNMGWSIYVDPNNRINAINAAQYYAQLPTPILIAVGNLQITSPSSMPYTINTHQLYEESIPETCSNYLFLISLTSSSYGDENTFVTY